MDDASLTKIRKFTAALLGFLLAVAFTGVLAFAAFVRLTDKTSVEAVAKAALSKAAAEWEIAPRGTDFYALDAQSYKKFLDKMEEAADPEALEMMVPGLRFDYLRGYLPDYGAKQLVSALAAYLEARNMVEISELVSASQRPEGITGFVASLNPPHRTEQAARTVPVPETIKTLVKEFFAAYRDFETDPDFRKFNTAMYGIQGRHSAEINGVLKTYNYSLAAFMADYGGLAVSEVSKYDAGFASVLSSSGGSLEPVVHAVRERMMALYYESLSNRSSATNRQSFRFETSRLRKAGFGQGLLTAARKSDATLVPLSELHVILSQRLASLIALSVLVAALFVVLCPGWSKLTGAGIAILVPSLTGPAVSAWLEAVKARISRSPGVTDPSFAIAFAGLIQDIIRRIYNPALLAALCLTAAGIVLTLAFKKRVPNRKN